MWREVSNYALKFHLQGVNAPRRVICFDLGSQCTGVSISDDSLTKAYLLSNIRQQLGSYPFQVEVGKLLRSKRPVGVVIGLPSAVKVGSNRIDIQERIKQVTIAMGGGTLPFTFVDQTWSTKIANERLKEMQQFYRMQGHLNHDKDLVDGMAAIIILRRFIEYYNK